MLPSIRQGSSQVFFFFRGRVGQRKKGRDTNTFYKNNCGVEKTAVIKINILNKLNHKNFIGFRFCFIIIPTLFDFRPF